MRVVCSCGTLRWRLKNLCQTTRTGFLTVAWGTGTPKDRDEVNRREVCECDGWVWDGIRLLWIYKTRTKDKTYIWVSVWWKTKNWSWGIYMSNIHWVARETGTPKERDEVNRRDVCERDGWVCVPEVIVVPSMLRLTLKTEVLTRVLPTSTFVCTENAARRKWKSPLFGYANWTPEGGGGERGASWGVLALEVQVSDTSSFRPQTALYCLKTWYTSTLRPDRLVT